VPVILRSVAVYKPELTAAKFKPPAVQFIVMANEPCQIAKILRNTKDNFFIICVFNFIPTRIAFRFMRLL